MPVTGQGPASRTVTRSTMPSSVKTWVMPSFLARIAAIRSGEADLDVHAGGQVVEALERVDRLRRGLVDVDEPLVRADLEVLLRVLVLERRADHGVDVALGGQGHRSGHRGARASRRLDDLLRRRLDGRVVIGLEPDADLVLGGCCHSVSVLSSVSGKLRSASSRAKGDPSTAGPPARRSGRSGGGTAGRIWLLLDDLGDDARADRTAALADREAQPLVH